MTTIEDSNLKGLKEDRTII